MGIITCRNADAPEIQECSVTNLTASLEGESSVRFTFQSVIAGVLTEGLGSVCYRTVGSSTWIEQQSGLNGAAGATGEHEVLVTNLAAGTYEFIAKANIGGVLCQSGASQIVIDSDIEPPVNPEECEFCQVGPTIVMEAEDGDIQGSDWIVSQTEAGYSGSGHIIFNRPTLTINGGGHDLDGGDASQTVKFNLQIKTPGDYLLKIKASALFDEAGDKNNDVWVSHTGANTPGQLPTANDLEKVYLGGISPNQTWAWTSQLDPTPPAADGPYWMTLSAGAHCITLTGRSGQFYIDRIALCLDGQGNPDAVESLACTGGTVTNPGEVNLTPDGKPTATGRYEPCDLISLHYDAAPDPDDLHAIAAGSCIADCYGLKDPDNLCVAVGTYGLRGYNPNTNGATGQTRWNDFIAASANVANNAYGSEGGIWFNVHTNADGQYAHIAAFAAKWKATIEAGCKVYVADGGPMDFTAQVTQYMQSALGCTNAELQQITVVQHSNWNALNTAPFNLAWVQSMLGYVLVDNGNIGGNNTAALQHHPSVGRDQGVDSAAFFAKVKAGPCGAAWAAAEDAYVATNATEVVDFSDTVELLYILNISQGANGTIGDIGDFCNTYAS